MQSNLSNSYVINYPKSIDDKIDDFLDSLWQAGKYLFFILIRNISLLVSDANDEDYLIYLQNQPHEPEPLHLANLSGDIRTTNDEAGW